MITLLARAFVLAVLLAVWLVPVAATAGGYRDRDVPMRVVANLDLARYAGLWYEIARFPNRFERGCVGVTAEYSLRPDGQVDVLNTCRKETLDGPVTTARGVARVEGPGRLSVSFVPWLPFLRGNYWVLHVDRDYTLAVVGEPRGRTGWILARTPRIDPASYGIAEEVLRRNGYDTQALYRVPQP